MSRLGIVVLLLLCACAAHSQNGLRLVGHLDQKHGVTSGVNYNGSWGYVAPDGREYALLGTATGTAIIEITDTNDIHEVVHIPGPTSLWREMRTHRDRLYVVTESGGGTQIIDLSQLPDTATLIKSVTYTSGPKNTSRSHSLQIFDGYMYLNGCGLWGTQAQRGAVIFSLADPDNPQFVGEYSPNYFHDSYVRNDTIFGASIYSTGGIYIADIKDKSAPIPIGMISYAGSGTHNVWTTKDGRYVISTDEIGATEKSLKFWDIGSLPSIPATPASTYLFNGLGDIEHNVFVRGDYAYTAWYTAGTIVVDVNDPTDPQTAGWYDSSVDSLFAPGNYDGVWGIYPYYWSGKITAGDMQNGLYVFVFDSLQARTPANLLEPAAEASFCDESPVEFRWTRVADPAKDPHVYQLHVTGVGLDTLFEAGTDTSIVLDPADLGFGSFQWSVVTKDEVNAIATQDTFWFHHPERIPAVLSPNGGEALKTGSQVSLAWNSICTDSVELSYSTNNGATWTLVAAAVPASPAAYLWTVPPTPTMLGRLRVRSFPDTALSDQSDAQFTIFNSQFMTVLSPNGGEIWKSGALKEISWSSGLVTHVAIDFSPDGGSSWQSVAADTPASATPVTWQVPDLSVTQALVRITDLDNGSVFDASDTTFTIWPKTLDVDPLWNLVSFPGTPADPAAAANFPGASSTLFRYASGYVQEDTVNAGIGYWVRYDSSRTLAFDGASPASDTFDVSEKWNMIGSLGDPVAVSSLVAIPGAMTLSTIYGFDADSGYYAADSITPGRGYWVKASEAGQIAVSSPPLRSALQAKTENHDLLSFTDASDRRRTLILGTLATDPELPPPPPAGSFDIRFASQNRAEEVGQEGSAIELRSVSYPLTVTLEKESSRQYRLVEKAGNVVTGVYPFAGGGAVIPAAVSGTLFLEAVSEHMIPANFALHQNWPNPFNPVTTITYDLFAAGRVSLKIYSLLGAEIATLVDEAQGPGRHGVEFVASALPSGVYLCRLRTETGTAMSKMVLAK